MTPVITKIPPAKGGPERFWQIIRANADAFTVRLILDGITPKVSRRAIRRYVVGLIQQGIVEVAGHRAGSNAGSWDETVYRCLKPLLPTPVSHDVVGSSHGQALQQIWNAMRALPQFTVDELVVAASTDERAVSRRYCSSFIRALQLHGLVRLVAPKRGTASGSTPAVYFLPKSANSGPRPPKVNRDGRGIVDPNRRIRISIAEPCEVSA